MRARCRNVHLLRVGYACRPRLSPRLTLGGLASPRKPRAHGGRVTLASLATHASILTPARSTAGRPAASPPAGSSPTDRPRSRRFGSTLSPVYCRRMSTRPVSCYALFEGVAASKPTSWLSGRTHILCHSRSGSVGGEAPSPVRCSTSGGYRATLALKLFRGERDISGFDRPFTPIRRSSGHFSTYCRSALHGVLPPLQPAHG